MVKKIRGIRQGELRVISDKEMKVLILSDVHIGHPNCDVNLFNKYLQWARESEARIWFLGDLIENGTKSSNTKAVYEQIISPREQLKTLSNILSDYSDIIDICIDGNHEDRTSKLSDINPLEVISSFLDYEWYDYYSPVLTTVYIGDSVYNVYLHHGTGGSKKKSSKIRIFEQILHRFPEQDLIVMGHFHSYQEYEDSTYINGKFRARKGVICSSFLSYLGSYAAANYEPPVPGFPVVNFRADGMTIQKLCL